MVVPAVAVAIALEVAGMEGLISLGPRIRTAVNAAEDATQATDTQWRLGDYKSAKKWANQMRDRSWTNEQIDGAIQNGQQFPGPKNNINPNNPATRYVHPITGRSVVRDNITKEILQVGDDKFKF